MLTPEPLGSDPEIWTVELLEQVMQTDATSSAAGQARVGSVVALWRYPVKSMIGEELNSSEVADRGLLGDRQFAVVDRATGKVGGAKNPRKWGNFFDFRASYAEAPKLGERISAVRITLPDGDVVNSDRADLEQILSRAFGRDIAFMDARAEGMTSGVAEEYSPDMAGLEYRDTVTDFELPAGTFSTSPSCTCWPPRPLTVYESCIPRAASRRADSTPTSSYRPAARIPASWRTTGSAARSSLATLFAWPSPTMPAFA